MAVKSTVVVLMLVLAVAQAEAATTLTQQPWGSLADGTAITKYTLTNASGARASFMALGAAILELQVPDKLGKRVDVVLGYDKASDYNTGNGAQFGLTIGRYANRLFGTRLLLEGKEFQLKAPPNRDGSPGTVVLHGGPEGFGARVWQAEAVKTTAGQGLRFSLISPDGDQGFPGELRASITYQWTDDFRLLVDYEATTNKPTVVNLTQHSYFNLAGEGNGDILGHTLQINADFFTFALPDNKPTGEIRSVRDTPFDFTVAKPIGRDIESTDPQMQLNRGYNQNFVLRGSQTAEPLAEAAILRDPISGRTLTVSTTEPGLFLYTGNFIDTRRAMKGGKTYVTRAGVALESGHFPDAPHYSHFPSTTLLPGQVYQSRTVFAFTAQ